MSKFANSDQTKSLPKPAPPGDPPTPPLSFASGFLRHGPQKSRRKRRLERVTAGRGGGALRSAMGHEVDDEQRGR